MTGQDLRRARLERSWNQQYAAARLGVSQGYLSLLEKGRRAVPEKLMPRFLRHYNFPPTALPVQSGLAQSERPEMFAHALGALGYPGFSYLRGKPKKNPAELLLTALMQPNLESRAAEGLPWVAFKYADMNWDWLVSNAKQHDLQNRLGFTLALAREVAEKTNDAAAALKLKQNEVLLERSRLAREDTFCHESLTEVEKRWLRENRSPEAQHWNLLTDLRADHLNYA